MITMRAHSGGSPALAGVGADVVELLAPKVSSTLQNEGSVEFNGEDDEGAKNGESWSATMMRYAMQAPTRNIS